jgi:DNA-binding protein HU-beta
VSKIPVNKAEIIDYIAENSEISKASATRALNAFLEAVTLSLRAGKSISLLGFGTFSVKPRAARVGRNPQTGEPINIEAANIPAFKAGKSLKDAVNCATIIEEEL